jgi:azurin
MGTATSTITGLNTAVYGVVDMGPSTNAGATYGAVFDFAQFTGTRATRPSAFIGFGEDSSATNPCLNLFDVGRLGKNVAQAFGCNSRNTNSFQQVQIRVLVNGAIRYIQLFSTSA